VTIFLYSSYESELFFYNYQKSDKKTKKSIEQKLSLTLEDFLNENKLKIDKKTMRLIKHASEDYRYIRIPHSIRLVIKKILNNDFAELVKEIKPYSLAFKLNLNKQTSIN